MSVFNLGGYCLVIWSTLFNILRIYQTISQRDGTILHYSQQSIRVPVSLQSQQHIIFPFFKKISHTSAFKMVFHYDFNFYPFMTKDDHLSMC